MKCKCGKPKKDGDDLCPGCKDRKERNARLAEAVKKGEYIPSLVDQRLIHYPPKPLIKKDEAAVERLYGKDEDKKEKKIRHLKPVEENNDKDVE